MIRTKTQFRYTDFWLSTEDMPFVEICLQSRMGPRYLDYSFVKNNDKINTQILKPINDYVYNLYPAPEFLRYEDGYIYLRQKTHADIWISTEEDGRLNVIDKPWMHQFYPSIIKLSGSECFNKTFRFYVPWFADFDTETYVVNATDEESPFLVLEGKLAPVKTNEHILEPNFVHFQFKHKNLINKTYGKIERGSSMFDLKIKVNKEDFNRFETFYKNYEFARKSKKEQ